MKCLLFGLFLPEVHGRPFSDEIFIEAPSSFLMMVAVFISNFYLGVNLKFKCMLE